VVSGGSRNERNKKSRRRKADAKRSHVENFSTIVQFANTVSRALDNWLSSSMARLFC